MVSSKNTKCSAEFFYMSHTNIIFRWKENHKNVFSLSGGPVEIKATPMSH